MKFFNIQMNSWEAYLGRQIFKSCLSPKKSFLILPPKCAIPFLLMDLANGLLFAPQKGTFVILLKTLKLDVACTYSLVFRGIGARAPQTHGVKRGWLKGRWAKEDVITKLLLALLKSVCFLRVMGVIFLFVNYHPDCHTLVQLYIEPPSLNSGIWGVSTLSVCLKLWCKILSLSAFKDRNIVLCSCHRLWVHHPLAETKGRF